MAKAKPRHSDSGIVSPWLGAIPNSNINVAGKSTPNQDGRYVTSEMLSRNSVVNNTTFVSNQTGDLYDRSGQPGGARFIKKVPVFPQPQPIQRMPVQLAAYTDYARKDEDLGIVGRLDQNIGGRRINTAGKPAVGVRVDDIESAQDFFNTRSVFVNPYFKDPYDKVGNDPDSKDRSRGPLIVPESRLDTLRSMSVAVNKWAEATSKYFNKPFVVGKSPVASGVKDAPLTTRVQIYGNEAGRAYAGMVGLWNSWTPGLDRNRKVLKAPGGENRVTPAKALRKAMTLNTDLKRFEDGVGPEMWAKIIQHEFGHTMGIGHPHTDPKGTTKNSEMSYDAPYHGATILPATINAYKKVMDMKLRYTGAEEIYKKRQQQADAAEKLQKLNQKYEKKKKYGY